MFTSILALFIAFALFLAACGNSGSSSSTGAAPDATSVGTTDQAGSTAGSATGMIEKLSLGSFGGGSNPQLNYNICAEQNPALVKM